MLSEKEKKMTIVLAALLMFAATAAAEPRAALRGSPLREPLLELTSFQLCELDRRSLHPRGECFPARVPGDVFTALWEAGRIPDPYQDLNSRQLEWVDHRAWRYETTFHYLPVPGRRLHLLFLGVDYLSRIELNGHQAAEHEGMFSRIDLDITDFLNSSGDQQLAVIIFGIPTLNWEEIKLLSTSEFGRRRYLKTQMSFDWDFAPRLKGGGIWDHVFLYESGPLSIRDLFLRPSLDGRVEVEVELAVPAAGNESYHLEIIGPGGETVVHQSGVCPAKEKVWTVSVQVPAPEWWWPWDQGGQPLYLARLSLEVNNQLSDEASEYFAFREFSWAPNPGAPPGSRNWVLVVNGRREFMRGANWVPPDAMSGRSDDSRYEKLLDMARQMGVNMIRVWGGGKRERRAFYDYCDRHGLLVWQEFPLACVFVAGYPHSRHFRELLQAESEEIIRQLRNHPSLFLWCGGNEFNVTQNAHVVKILADNAARLDPTRDFIPASPYQGDVHNWTVWHNYGNLSDYFADLSPLPSEFGLQAFPNRATLEKYFSPENLWPINEVHIHHDLGKSKLMKYVKPLQPEDHLDAWISASQLIQAHYLQRGIENWRQQKYRTSGTAFWQLNEPWPAISWAVIDYELQPKLAYHVLKNSYNPLLVTARFEDRAWRGGETFQAEIMVVNDFHEEFASVQVEASVCESEKQSWKVNVVADAVVSAGVWEILLPADCHRPELYLSLRAGEKELAENRYFLWVHDPEPAPKAGRLLEQVGKRIMTGAKGEKAVP